MHIELVLRKLGYKEVNFKLRSRSNLRSNYLLDVFREIKKALFFQVKRYIKTSTFTLPCHDFDLISDSGKSENMVNRKYHYI